MSDYKRYSLEVQRSNFRERPWDIVKWTQQGSTYATLQYLEKPVKAHIKRLDKHTYKVLKTGEIKEYDCMSEIKKRLAKRNALNRTFESLRGIIRANFVNENEPGSNAQLFITLTYAENMQDHKRLFKDFEKFIKRLAYAFKDHDFAYVVVMEPQGRGAWHAHLMLKSLNHDVLYIPKEKINELWPFGYSTTERLKSNDVGAYYTAYFTGLIAEISADNETGEDALHHEELEELYARLVNDDEHLTKMHQKSRRLGLYPKGMRFFRCSRNVSRPQNEQIMAIEVPDDYEEIYSQSYEIKKVSLDAETMGETESLNHIRKATLKKK